MSVFLFRHGEVYNPDNILYGRSNDYHLSEEGLAQVVRAADKLILELKSSRINIISSPLSRTLETSEYLSKKININYISIDKRLIEAYNLFEGSNMAGGKNIISNPKAWPKLINPFKPSWGEPYREITERMVEAIEEHRNDNSDTILVSHELPIFMAKRYYSGKGLIHDPRKRDVPLASFIKLF